MILALTSTPTTYYRACDATMIRYSVGIGLLLSALLFHDRLRIYIYVLLHSRPHNPIKSDIHAPKCAPQCRRYCRCAHRSVLHMYMQTDTQTHTATRVSAHALTKHTRVVRCVLRMMSSRTCVRIRVMHVPFTRSALLCNYAHAYQKPEDI